MIVAGEEGLFVVLEGAGQESGSDLVDEVDDEMFIMDGGEDFGGDFVGFEQVMQICFVVIFTTFAITVGHEGGEVVFVFGVLDVDSAVGGVE